MFQFLFQSTAISSREMTAEEAEEGVSLSEEKGYAGNEHGEGS